MSGSINDFTKWLASPDGRKVVEQIMKETTLDLKNITRI